jgi:hypothetical protein
VETQSLAVAVHDRRKPAPARMKRRRGFPKRLALACFALLIGLTPPPVEAADNTYGSGSRFDSLIIGGKTYQRVVIREVTPRSVVILHAGGMVSLRLRDLPPEWQERFHYNPAAEAAAERAATAPPLPARRGAAAIHAKGDTAFDRLLRQFGQPAEVRPEVDLRPKFFQLELGVKNQGRRPSCAIFSIVSALEFQNAELTGRAEKFSEEYLIWATRKTTQRTPPPTVNPGSDTINNEDRDEGFSLFEVVDALRAYGIPLQSTMPNTFGRSIESIEDPPPDIVQAARTHQRVFVHQVPGRDNATRINNIVHALNAGIPVAVGIAWPHYRTLRNGYLSGQKPMAGAGHAVTLVGYHSPTGRIEDAFFVFKNSWGVDWGQGGYGTATYGYLNNYLNDAVLLEVQPVSAAGS